MNRADRRRQERERRRLSERVERELDADREFFKRFPRRRYYVRPIGDAEREHFERISGRPLRAPEGAATYVAVEEVFPGARLRLPFFALGINLDTLSEQDCQNVFFTLLPGSPHFRLRAKLIAYSPAERRRA